RDTRRRGGPVAGRAPEPHEPGATTPTVGGPCRAYEALANASAASGRRGAGHLAGEGRYEALEDPLEHVGTLDVEPFCRLMDPSTRRAEQYRGYAGCSHERRVGPVGRAQALGRLPALCRDRLLEHRFDVGPSGRLEGL